MKNIIRISILTIIITIFQACTVKSNEKWSSEFSNLELNFDDTWELIIPNVDTEDQTIVGLKDHSDNSSLIAKITNDVSKDQLSDESYFNAVKKQMLNANSENKLITEGEFEFKGTKYYRLIFFMKTKFGEMIHTVYMDRNGQRFKAIQFTYPVNLIENPAENMPSKFEKLLNAMII